MVRSTGTPWRGRRGLKPRGRGRYPRYHPRHLTRRSNCIVSAEVAAGVEEMLKAFPGFPIYLP